jgi:hypothetical protein
LVDLENDGTREFEWPSDTDEDYSIIATHDDSNEPITIKDEEENDFEEYISDQFNSEGPDEDVDDSDGAEGSDYYPPSDIEF